MRPHRHIYLSAEETTRLIRSRQALEYALANMTPAQAGPILDRCIDALVRAELSAAPVS